MNYEEAVANKYTNLNAFPYKDPFFNTRQLLTITIRIVKVITMIATNENRQWTSVIE